MISVVIPMYNSRNTIIKCIDSVLMQSREDLIEEIIVVDDGSTDFSDILVADKFKHISKVKLFSKENGGVSSARNMGIRYARAKWIALLDSDDVWLPEKIEMQWNQILKNREIKFIGCNRNNENIHWGKRVNDELYMLDLKHILIKNWPHTSTVLIKKEVFCEVGLFNEKMKYAEDSDMWNRIVCRFPLFYIPVSYEIAGDNKAQFGECGLSANLKEMYKGNIRNIRKLKQIGEISYGFYIFLKVYNDLKYLRRILLTTYRKRKKY